MTIIYFSRSRRYSSRALQFLRGTPLTSSSFLSMSYSRSFHFIPWAGLDGKPSNDFRDSNLPEGHVESLPPPVLNFLLNLSTFCASPEWEKSARKLFFFLLPRWRVSSNVSVPTLTELILSPSSNFTLPIWTFPFRFWWREVKNTRSTSCKPTSCLLSTTLSCPAVFIRTGALIECLYHVFLLRIYVVEK